MGGLGSEAQKLVWEGAIPLEIRLHESEITTHPPPPPALILGPRLAYLPLLAHQLKPYFSDTLPPGADTVWFDYRGLPLKWHIPIGVLFDLLCGEPERPWNLTVHFRGYPTDILSPCEDEDSVKWSFINSLKEAAYIINGNCKNIMNMSQADQLDLWRSLVNGKLLTLYDTLKILLPELFEAEPSIDQELSRINIEESRTTETTSNPQDLENAINSRCKEMKETPDECQSESFPYRKTEIKLVRIQGIEPKLDIPFAWVVKNLTNPDHFLHISVFVNASLDQTNLR
ncbi:hypothetical protein Sjap_026078 [Stephania japonica]|uniref:Autophagy protein 5 n=1 Tax=Stephania japonica TaxID=461633 RepID=A0AAP0E7B3_9MAGN